MKKVFYLLFFLLFSVACFGQNLKETTLKSYMMGYWLNLDDTALTVNITRDSIIQSTNGSYAEADLYTYRITRHGCRGNRDKSPTGYYVTEKDSDDGESLCGTVLMASKNQITISFPDDLLVLKRIR